LEEAKASALAEKESFEKMIAEQIAADEEAAAEERRWREEEAEMIRIAEEEVKEKEAYDKLNLKIAEYETKLADETLTQDQIDKFTRMKNTFDAELIKIDTRKGEAIAAKEAADAKKLKEETEKKAKAEARAKETEFDDMQTKVKNYETKMKT